MKKSIAIAGMTLPIALLLAGGNTKSDLSEVAELSVSDYKNYSVYVEYDTGLMWQDAPYTDAEDGAYKRNYSVGKAGTRNYAINYCRKLNYGGYTNWRLPTADELSHVHRKTGQLFKNHRSGDFWTSTPAATKKYYVIYPADGYRYERDKKESNYIRCVRYMTEDSRKRKSLIE